MPNSRHTKRTFGRSSLDTLERSVSRQVSESQNLRKDELVDRTKLQIDLLDRFAVQNSQYSLRNRYCCARRKSHICCQLRRVSAGFRQTTILTKSRRPDSHDSPQKQNASTTGAVVYFYSFVVIFMRYTGECEHVF